MKEIKTLDVEAFNYLEQRDHKTWNKAFFKMDRCSATFENGIYESFNSALLAMRSKPLIPILEDIKIYMMEINWTMNKIASELDDNTCPSIRRTLEQLKVEKM